MRKYPQLRFTPVLSEATGTDYRVGWVHEAVLADYPNLREFDVYAAGPPALIESIRSEFPPANGLFFDSFDYADDGVRPAQE